MAPILIELSSDGIAKIIQQQTKKENSTQWNLYWADLYEAVAL